MDFGLIDTFLRTDVRHKDVRDLCQVSCIVIIFGNILMNLLILLEVLSYCDRT
jgi:hypothetical protein